MNIHDQLTNVSSSAAATAMYAVTDALQDMRPGQMAVGAALYLVLLAEHYGESARDILSLAERVDKDIALTDTDIHRAIRAYLTNELPRD